MNDDSARRYEARFRKVIDYIDQHADAVLGLERLGAVAALSACHFHRQFSATLGIRVSQYVLLLRMKRATHQLAYRREISVLNVALSNGYSAPEPFTRALRRLIGQSPREFRERPDWDALQSALQPLGDMRSRHLMAEFTLHEVSIVRFPETRVALLAHRGDPRRLGDSIRRFIAWRRRNALPPQRSETYNICHDDPEDCDPEAFRFDLCAATLGEILPNDEGVEAGTIPAGRCALLRLVGPDDRLDAAARFLYGTWLPQSGQELREFPLYLRRVKFFPEVAESLAITELFLPLR